MLLKWNKAEFQKEHAELFSWKFCPKLSTKVCSPIRVLKLSPLQKNKFITYYNTLLFDHYDGSEDANLCCSIKCWHVSSVSKFFEILFLRLMFSDTEVPTALATIL